MAAQQEITLTIKYPEDLLLSLKESKQEFETEAKYLLALKLYELGKISSGKAAKLAGLTRVDFLMKLGKYRVSPFQVDLEEILEEARSE
jgi:predicted HTH domain antitoxin